MNLTNFITKCISTTVRDAKTNKATLLSGVACVGVVVTAYEAYKAGKEQYDLELNRDYDLKFRPEVSVEEIKKEYVKQTAINYAKPVVTGIGTLACIALSNKIHIDEKAALLAAYELSRDRFDNLANTVKNKMTEKQQDTIAKEFNEKQNDYSLNNITDQSVGGYLYKESFSGQFFRSTDDRIQKAINKFNKKINSAWDGYEITLNEWLDILDSLSLTPVETCDAGNYLYFYNEDLGPMGLEVSTNEITGKHRGSGEAYCELTYNQLPTFRKK